MELGAAGYAAAGAATAGGVGIGLFGYNRGNYMMDQKLHWARFQAGYAMAMAQTAQYKQDLADLTALTCNRMHCYADIAGMTATILTAIFCPGRVGLHTPPPPGWCMGLMMVNVGGAYIWLGLTMWLAMHASLKASACQTHMFTRFVRLPIPAGWMLDRARKFLGSWEEQPLSEVLRIPYFFRHGRGGKDKGEDEMQIDPDALRRARNGNDVPAWYRKEKAVDFGEPFESMMPIGAQGTAPEHFEVYREMQNEWWPYDVYARLSIFLAFMHLVHCWTYQHLGHLLAENRAVLAAGAVVMPTCVLQQIILTLDIMPGSTDIPLQRLGPFAQIVAWWAMAIEYQPYYNSGQAAIGYILVYVAYAFHIIYTIQLLRICAPDVAAPEMAEVPQGTWWPMAWRLPKAFKHAIWLVAPPRHLEPGQNDLVGEMRKASEGGVQERKPDSMTFDDSDYKRRDVHRALGKQGESPAWWNVKMGLSGLLIAWVYLTVGFTIEIITAHTPSPSMLNAFGLPNNLRDPRYRPPKAGYHAPTEVGTGGVAHGPAVGVASHERRLSLLGDQATTDIISAVPRSELAEKLRSVIPYLNDLAQGRIQSSGRREVLPASVASMVPDVSASLTAAPALAKVHWPALFEPRLLACGHAAAHGAGKLALALSQHGRGMIISTPASHHGVQEIPAEAHSFSLDGAHGYGPLVAAAWDELGLLLAASTGTTLECPGVGPTDGVWRCRPAFQAKLPIGHSVPFRGTVALSRAEEGQKALRAAVTFPGESTVTVFSHSGELSDSWLPAGEVRTRANAASAAFSAAAKELLLASADGAVARLHMGQGLTVPVATPVDGHFTHNWQATCGLHSGGVARLAVRNEPGARVPMLFLS
eukprot:TRINITY_DN3893_c0_g1_i1.p1 TRINITY_DN3893_c0_g1~~TRINITY_DN3893_c0_g1_i1.p1  ORF type:complete len:869 (-),score=173.57 TRINITY_DN3893_c0_g1_i1:165-2771(-)